MALFGPVMQILVAILLVIILFVIGFFIYNMELANSIRNAGRLQKETIIYSGVKDLYSNKNEQYNTTNKDDVTFLDIGPSVNQSSGAEFTYNFWLYLDYTKIAAASENETVLTDNGIKDKDIVLFLHGDKNVYTYKNICNNDKTDVMIKCPLVKLERAANVLTVELNTMNSPDGVHEESRSTCTTRSNDWRTVNSHKLSIEGLRTVPEYDKKWFMVTLIVQDTSPTDPLPLRNKVRCRVFINGINELDRFVDGGLNPTSPSILRVNQGNFHVAPTLTWTENASTLTNVNAISEAATIYMADLSYFNYVLDKDTIKKMYESGFSKKYAATAGQLNDNDFMNKKAAPAEKKQFFAY
jgi:hypothetical protein